VTGFPLINMNFAGIAMLAKAKDKFMDPSAGGAAHGNEGNPLVLFSCAKKESHTHKNGFRSLFRLVLDLLCIL